MGCMTQPTRLEVPPLWCPVPERINPAWRGLQARSEAWAAQWGLADDDDTARRLAAAGSGELGARVTASSSGDGPQFAADHLTWLFAFDDTFCDEGSLSHDPVGMSQLAAALIRTAQTGLPCADGPVPRALADLRARLDALGSCAQASRWVDALRDYLFHQVWEAAHRAADTTPDLVSYLVARISTGSMTLCVAILGPANGYEAPVEELEARAIRALSEMCCAVVGYDNDIMSHWKEALRSGDGINLIDVLVRRDCLAPSKALREAVVIRDRVLARYLRLRDQMLPAVSPLIHRHIDGLDAWIRGNLDWGMRSHRYFNPENPAGLPNTPITTAPARPVPDADPIPGLDWWWRTTAADGSRGA